MVDWDSIFAQIARWTLAKKCHLVRRPSDSTREDVFDVIIIGGSFSGLCSAAILAQFGLHVCVVERNETLGGSLGKFERNVPVGTGEKTDDLFFCFDHSPVPLEESELLKFLDQIKTEIVDPVLFKPKNQMLVSYADNESLKLGDDIEGNLLLQFPLIQSQLQLFFKEMKNSLSVWNAFVQSTVLFGFKIFTALSDGIPANPKMIPIRVLKHWMLPWEEMLRHYFPLKADDSSEIAKQKEDAINFLSSFPSLHFQTSPSLLSALQGMLFLEGWMKQFYTSRFGISLILDRLATLVRVCTPGKSGENSSEFESNTENTKNEKEEKFDDKKEEASIPPSCSSPFASASTTNQIFVCCEAKKITLLPADESRPTGEKRAMRVECVMRKKKDRMKKESERRDRAECLNESCARDNTGASIREEEKTEDESEERRILSSSFVISAVSLPQMVQLVGEDNFTQKYLRRWGWKAEDYPPPSDVVSAPFPPSSAPCFLFMVAKSKRFVASALSSHSSRLFIVNSDRKTWMTQNLSLIRITCPELAEEQAPDPIEKERERGRDEGDEERNEKEVKTEEEEEEEDSPVTLVATFPYPEVRWTLLAPPSTDEDNSETASMSSSSLSSSSSSRPSSYVSMKQKMIEDALTVLDKLIPNFRSNITFVEGATAATIRKYTQSPSGSHIGFRTIPACSAVFRAPIETPISGLLCIGNWTQPGGGTGPSALSSLLSAVSIFHSFSRIIPLPPLISSASPLDSLRLPPLLPSASTRTALHSVQYSYQPPPLVRAFLLSQKSNQKKEAKKNVSNTISTLIKKVIL
ncbi:uncharacterized protein MONOS_2302 [Monocercomonoides exilis]|uniref:uncharacterized protein n=1 Tax=Monocercomonoides exilis TaxID=2049356 RepID=UPI003559F85A|nr:hypothetical protein MONOS_2302 [Monocercomonoides exilis]|eukprot:MONOS_2302.1-p1 / transcript=MONOS_2302.1 / gene=MONOS_2302 / organism=Monocercomonoides_exilis_PA203 / gene_product=unspecified product / transcript_product=unspecified product / location=Mono_scaffold00047:21512-25266(-) / protein_length=806 / sequence_SO=supercontig / SO=protein_coding / is_pseudo=false